MTSEPNEAGVTLLELLVVMAVLTVVLSLALPRIRTTGGAASLEAAARVIAGTLRETRSRAIADKLPMTVTVDIAAHTLTTGNSAPRYRIPDAYTVVLTTVDDLAMAQRGSFVFFPNGGSTGGSITLSDQWNKQRVAINWLTGAVVMVEEGDAP